MIVENITLLTGKEYVETELRMGLGFLILEISTLHLNANYYGTLSLIQETLDIRNGVNSLEVVTVEIKTLAPC